MAAPNLNSDAEAEVKKSPPRTLDINTLFLDIETVSYVFLQQPKPSERVDLYEILIDKLQGALTTCKTRRNASLPVNLLPNEILSLIFRHSTEESYGQFSDDHLSRLMLVCRQWAGIVSNDPHVWGHISIASIYGAHKQLRRLQKSKSFPIQVKLSAYREDHMFLLFYIPEILNHAPRIQSLDLNGTRKFTDQAIAQFAAASPQALTRLKIRSSLLREEETHDPQPLPISLVTTLRRLEAFEHPIPWKSLQGLTHLEYSHSAMPEFFPGTRTLISTLREMPLLTYLGLTWAPRSDLWASEVFEDSHVDLPLLQNFMLTVDLDTFNFLLSSIAVPPNCKLCLTPLHIGSASAAAPLLSKVKSIYTSTMAPIIHSVQVGGEKGSSFLEISTFSDTALHASLRRFDTNKHLTVHYTPHSETNVVKLMQLTFESLNVQNVTHLDIRNGLYLTSGGIMGRCIASLPSLTTVHVSFNDRLALIFLDIIIKTLGVRPDGSNRVPISIPKLESIYLSGWYMEEFHGSVEPCQQLLDETVEEVIRVATRFRDLGSPLKVVSTEFTATGVYAKWEYIEKLLREELVQTCIWEETSMTLSELIEQDEARELLDARIRRRGEREKAEVAQAHIVTDEVQGDED